MAVSNFARNQTIPVPHATAKTTLIVPPQPPPRNAPSPPQPKPIRKAAIAWTDRTLKAYEDSPVSTSISAPASRSTSTSKSTSTSTPVSAPPTSMRSVRKEKNTVPAIAGTVNQMATGPKNSSCIRLPSRGVAVTGGYAEAVIRLQSITLVAPRGSRNQRWAALPPLSVHAGSQRGFKAERSVMRRVCPRGL